MAELIAADAADVVDRVAAVLGAGGTVVLPTDTVYGLAALADRGDAVARVFELKQRPPGLHLAVLVAGVEQVALVSDDQRDPARRLMATFWPGALTVVLGEARGVYRDLGNGDGTVGVRCPDHDLVRAVAASVGPIAVTSANPHGRPTPDTAAGVAAALPGVDLVVDGGRCAGGVASTVVHLGGDVPRILRHGPVDEDAITAAWSSSSGA